MKPENRRHEKKYAATKTKMRQVPHFWSLLPEVGIFICCLKFFHSEEGSDEEAAAFCFFARAISEDPTIERERLIEKRVPSVKYGFLRARSTTLLSTHYCPTGARGSRRTRVSASQCRNTLLMALPKLEFGSPWRSLSCAANHWSSR